MRLYGPAVVVLASAFSPGLAGCDAPDPAGQNGVKGGPGRPALPARAAQPALRHAVPIGPEETRRALAAAELQQAASVSQLHAIPTQDAKLFSVSGGDPAANGLVTYLGLFAGPAEGWRLYPLGDFAAWRVTETGPGRLVLNVRQDSVGPNGPIVSRGGDIVSRDSRLIVSFARSDGQAPAAVTVTPAR